MVTIKLDKERRLLRTLRGMKLFEDKTGKSLLKGFDPKELTTEDIYILLWSLLIHEDSGLQLEKIEGMTDHVDAMEIMQKIAETLKA